MIYGNPQYVLVTDSTDRVGIRTLVVSKLWQPDNSGKTFEEIFAGRPDAPIDNKSVMLVGDQTLPVRGAYRTYWTMEGIDSSKNGIELKGKKTSPDCGFKTGLAQVSLKVWRGLTGQDANAFQKLLDQYEGYLDPDSDQIIWPATLSGTSSGGSGLGATAPTGVLNPVFGMQDFFRMEGTYWHRYATLELPEDLYSGCGLVATDIGGTPPKLTEGRNFLKVSPEWKKRGIVYDITESYWMSGIGGWPQPIYGGGK